MKTTSQKHEQMQMSSNKHHELYHYEQSSLIIQGQSLNQKYHQQNGPKITEVKYS